MKIKTEADYIDELVDLFPVMPRKEMERIVKLGTTQIVKYLRMTTVRKPSGVVLGTKSVLMPGKLSSFTMTPSHTKKSFIIKREGLRAQAKRKKEKDESKDK